MLDDVAWMEVKGQEAIREAVQKVLVENDDVKIGDVLRTVIKMKDEMVKNCAGIGCSIYTTREELHLTYAQVTQTLAPKYRKTTCVHG